MTEKNPENKTELQKDEVMTALCKKAVEQANALILTLQEFEPHVTASFFNNPCSVAIKRLEKTAEVIAGASPEKRRLERELVKMVKNPTTRAALQQFIKDNKVNE